MSSQDFDVAIVGAGPSGTAAGYQLVRQGLRVLMLDRHTFPRMKPCGGGLTIKALNLMPYSVGPVLEQATNKLGMGVKGESGRKRFEVFKTEGHVCAFAVRQAFDRFNFERTMAAGATFDQIRNISQIDERQDEVRITADGRRIAARYLIGADGANSVVRKLATKATWFQRGFAIEGLVPYGLIGREPLAEFFFGYVPNGYGWLFPKGDHVNVGIYTYDDNVSLSKDQLRAYALDRLGTDKLEQIAGYPLGFGGRRYAPASDRVVLVGDAAGFSEPLLGEGIHNALKSGQIAAKAIVSVETRAERDLRSAYRSGLRPVINDVARCDDLARNFFYRNLDGIVFGALSFPISKATLMWGFAAGKTMYEITNTFFLSPFYSVTVPPSLQDYLSRTVASASGQAKAAPISRTR